MSDDAVKIDEMVDAYLAIRGEREKLSRDFELRDAELKADQVQIE